MKREISYEINTSSYDVFENVKKEQLINLANEKMKEQGFDKVIEDLLAENKNISSIEELKQELIKQGKLKELMDSLTKPQQTHQRVSYSSSSKNIHLYLNLKQGHSFIDHDTNKIIDTQSDKPPVYLEFDIQFFGKRYHTPKIPASGDFNINQSFTLDFNPLHTDIDLTYNILRKIQSPIHVVLLEHENGVTRILSSKNIEWRWALCYGSWGISVEFKEIASLNSVNVGTVDMVLSLSPVVDKSNLLSESAIMDQLNSERKNEVEKTQDFVQYSTEWWEDYKTIHPSHSSRLVKLFLPTEDREYYSYKPACALIEPILVGRAINTPYEAARFVSLIPFERRENPGGAKIEIWHTMHSFLTLRKGDVEDHVVLLCNLLLGFGLDAYVCSGIAVNGPHLWVCTRAKIDSKNYQVVYWESLTGQRIKVDDPKVFRFYKRIHCVFNNENFYGNIQKDDNVFNTIYNFEDESLWKNIPKDKIVNVTKYAITPILDVINVDKYQIEIDLESMLKKQIQNFRKGLELNTNWDAKLSHLISPCLVNYEMERISNLTYGNDEFKASIKNYVPEGYTFKAYPFQMNELDPDKIYGMILASDIGKDILHTRGDQITFAVRCKVYAYPQHIYSLWVMFATRYRVIK